jgi:hypothetical protein
MTAFAERVERVTGRRYDPSTVSLLERDKQGWRLADVRALAAVDPLKRGAPWLSALDVEIEQAPAKRREQKRGSGISGNVDPAIVAAVPKKAAKKAKGGAR